MIQQLLLVLAGWFTCIACIGQQAATIAIHAGTPTATVQPSLHGIFFEEISHGGEGGLYAELIQNRGFEDARLPLATTLHNGFIVPNRTPHFSLSNNAASDWKMPWNVQSQWPAWTLQTGATSNISLALTQQQPLNSATPHSLQVSVKQLDKKGNNNLVNEGFWGIHTVKGEKYHLSFYARTSQFKGPLTVSLQSTNGTVLARQTLQNISGKHWKKYTCTLQAKASDPKARFVITFGSTGTVWLDFVSLFPARTFNNRPNGLRADLAQHLANLKPAFVRWPGGCFVEGINIENAPSWRRSIGPVEKRPGTYSPWGYWSSDGFGYYEFLQFCEDIGADALYVFNAGVSCDFRSGTFIPDSGVDSIVQDVLDGIEYAIGPITSKWGKLRAAHGHAKPFPLKYIEVGNEQAGPRYARRYNWFYNAIKTKYPQLQIVASMGIGDVNRRTLDSMHQVDLADEHAYKWAYWSMRNYNHFDKYRRGNWDMYVGEYATNAGVGKGNMLAALSDAVYIMAMERNCDLVKMSSYAPLLVNVNDVDWPVNLIHFDAARSFGRISYYTIKMMNEHRASQNLLTETTVLPATRQEALYKGSIGLATWDTEAEFKDIEVTENGKVVYKSDFINRPGEWKPVHGTWQTKDGAFAQTAMGPQRFAWLPGKSFETYTLKLKARKTSHATNAFIIPFAVKDDGTMMRAHIGSYVNKNSVFERVSNGFDVADLTTQQKLPSPIEVNRWYNVVLEVGYHKVDCYLDGQLLMTYTEPPAFFSIAGRDEQTGEVIVKVVNASAKPYQTTLEMDGMQAGATAKLITLAAESPEAENSLEHPVKYIPVTSTVTGFSNRHTLQVPAYSISIIRLHDESWKKETAQAGNPSKQ